MKQHKREIAVTKYANEVELVEKEGQYLSRTVKNGYFRYAGTQTLFRQRVSLLKFDDRQEIVEASITITGSKVKQQSPCCYLITIILGVCLLVPFFCMCCRWWDKIAYPAYEISLETYTILQRMILSTKINTLNLTVYDNNFDKDKCDLLQRMIQKSTLKSFNFQNRVKGFDFKAKEKSNFKTNIAPIKQLLLESSHLQWNDDTL